MEWLYIWLFVTASALVVEFLTADMVSIWFVGGGIVAMILTACGLDWYFSLPAFIAVSFLLMLCFRKYVMQKLDKRDSRTNADSALEKEFRLLTPIGFNSPGTIRINDVVWNAVTEDDTAEVPAGTIVVVKEIKGNKYVVSPIAEKDANK